MSVASALGLTVDDAVLLQNSNRLAVRLLPCDALARVAPVARRAADEFELDVVRRLAGTDAPVAGLDPRVEPGVHVQDGFAVSLWKYHESVHVDPSRTSDYARALERLHAGMRQLEVSAPHYTDRVAEAQSLVADSARTPDLGDADREFLGTTLRTLTQVIDDHGADEQLLHGEPHPGNLLMTDEGLLFVDFETCCRGPVEFDIAHAPDDVSHHYPSVSDDLVRTCRILMLAMITTWRWDRDDQFPNGHQLGNEWLAELRAMRDA